MYACLSCKAEQETASSPTVIFLSVVWDEFDEEVVWGISLRSPASFELFHTLVNNY